MNRTGAARPGAAALVVLTALVGCKRATSEAAAERGGRTARAAREAPGPAGEPRPLAAIAADAVCPTKGALRGDGDGLRITEPVVRAIAPGTAGDAAALRFTYRGFTAESVALGSGQIRRQLGLKLRAADGCNLVYVMWRIDPGPGIEVSIKRNPGAHTHAECGTAGYTKLTSARRVKAPRLEPDVEHTLQAELVGDELIAWIDDQVVWQGGLDGAADDLVGPVGLRTDNVVVDAVLSALPAEGAAAVGCPAGLDGD